MTGEKIRTTDLILIFVTFAGVTLILLGIENNKPKVDVLPNPNHMNHHMSHDVTINAEDHRE